MTRPGRRPGRRGFAGSAVLLGAGALVAALAAPGSSSASPTSTTTTSNPWVPGIGGTMTLGIDQAPVGCNPATASGDNWATRLLLSPVLPSAFQVNDNGQPAYDYSVITQAELQSTKPETVVYTIDPKAVWSDGTPITAADFVYTWQQERGLTGPVSASGGTLTTGGAGTAGAGGTSGASGGAGGAGTATSPTALPAATFSGPALPGATATTGPALGYRQIASVKGSNQGRTVTVVFKAPYADWQSLFDDLLPAHVMEKAGWDPSCATLDPSIDLSGGPFELGKIVPGHEVDLVRNPKWWGQVPDLSRLVVRVASSPAQLAKWLAHGKVDVALPTGFDDAYLQRVTSLPQIMSQGELTTTFLQLELSTTSAATASIDVRQAIAHAIDRQALIGTVVGWANSSIVPAASHLYAQGQNGYPGHKPPPLQVSGQPGYTSTTAVGTGPTQTPFPPTADMATTNRLLSGIGYVRSGGTWHTPDGKPFSVKLAVDEADPWAAQTGPLIASQLEQAGIGVTLVSAPSAQAAGTDLSSGLVDLALLPMHVSPYGSQAISWYTPLLGATGSGGSQDWSNLDDLTLNTLLVKASEELNPVDAAPIYSKADQLLWQDMPGLPLFTEPSVLAWSGITAGVSPNPNGASLLWAPLTWSMRVPPNSPDTATGSGSTPGSTAGTHASSGTGSATGSGTGGTGSGTK